MSEIQFKTMDKRAQPLGERVPTEVYTAVFETVGYASTLGLDSKAGFDASRAEIAAVNLLQIIGDVLTEKDNLLKSPA